ncbi:hypothetical protein FNW52_19465 [Flavobacterium sp. ZT3R18]|uniref:hypothetical protein n=1 Tax=Flavobacterium sp. ZT3R18 TaxID=2594429 RepID=UPI00117A9ABD|nr:hypothetical protein [Flavobacterium sp. ZT3R18]TRX30894.1 hypothetical protein FNW52_19465 [Flavobacterium sp. ZT3R18]
MYHNILIQKNHPLQLQVEKVVEILIGFIETDSIYFSEHLEEKVNLGIITIIISKNSPHYWDDIYEYSWKIFEAYPEFSFRVYNAEWVKEELSEGNTFFVMHCSEHELVYSYDDNNSVVLLKKINGKRLIKKTKETFYLHFKESGIIGRDLKFHLRCENSTMAVYTMYQQLRSLFISVSWFLTGEWIVEHSLEMQLKHLRMFSSSVGNAFDPEKEEEWFILEQLENARGAIQCNAEIEPISEETLKAVSAKVDYVEKEIARLFQQSIARCKEKLGIPDDNQEIRIPVAEINSILDFPDNINKTLAEISLIINENCKTDAIYCFGYRNSSKPNSTGVFIKNESQNEYNHFYLIVLTEKQKKKAVRKLSELIRDKTNSNTTVTLLLHKTASLKEIEANQHYFFYQTLIPERLVYQKQEILSYVNLEIRPQRNLVNSRIYLGYRQKSAFLFLEAHAAIGKKGETMVSIVLLNQAVEHICLGLINSILGYCPNHYSVEYLINLCDNFTTLTLEIFPRNTEHEKELFQILCYRPNLVRYNEIDAVYYPDVQILSKRCKEFQVRANELGRQELERIEKMNINN